MKRGIVALVLVIIVGIIAGFEYLYITSSTDIYVQMLTTAEEQIEKNNITGAQETIEKLDHRYIGSSGLLNVFLPHTDVESIGLNLSMLRRYCQVGELEEYLALSAATKRMFINMNDAQQPHIGNIL